jgi:hypothetical protein
MLGEQNRDAAHATLVPTYICEKPLAGRCDNRPWVDRRVIGDCLRAPMKVQLLVELCGTELLPRLLTDDSFVDRSRRRGQPQCRKCGFPA